MALNQVFRTLLKNKCTLFGDGTAKDRFDFYIQDSDEEQEPAPPPKYGKNQRSGFSGFGRGSAYRKMEAPTQGPKGGLLQSQR